MVDKPLVDKLGMNNARMGPVLRDAWRLATPYFRSEERWVAWLLLASVIGLSLFSVAVDVLLNSWRGAFYDSLQARDLTAFIDLLLTWRVTESGFMPGFLAIVSVYLPLSVLRGYLQKLLSIRWRRWMTARLTTAWLSGHAYYTIGLTAVADEDAGTDNPDQRIAEDVRDYVQNALDLGISFLSTVVSFVSFAGILWALSGDITVLGWAIPGYMLWLAILYAGVGSWLTHRVGRALIPLNVRRQRAEADFRYGLVRLRDNTEGVALSGGEATEQAAAGTRFAAIRANWIALARRELKVNLFTDGFAQAAAIFPIVIAAPRYFAGTIQLGDLMRTAGAFGSVNDALSWFVTAYAKLADWRSQIVRLTTFQQAITAAQSVHGPDRAANTAAGMHETTITLPDGDVLMDRATLTIRPRQSTLITGRSGSGKSTLFRTLAGIWPFATGTVAVPPGRVMFLPQKPYVPPGTLRAVVCYPAADAPADAVQQALTTAGLAAFIPALDEDAPWQQRLSGGELQRMAIARALLTRPDWLFLDEATSSLDPAAEATLYEALRANLPGTTLVSIAHRPAVAAYHDRVVAFDRPSDAPGRLVEASPAPRSPVTPPHTL